MTVDLDSLIVTPAHSLLETLKVIDTSGLEVALLCDQAGKLIGVATDGDCRRAIIAGKALSTPIAEIANPRFSAVGPEINRSDAVQLMLERGFNCLPVIDAAGKLVDLHTLRNAMLGNRSASWAVIIAGGKGERLGELTTAIPKPMLPIGDRPILERIVQHLVAHGIRRIYLSVNYLGTMIQDHFGDGSRFTCAIEYLWEKEPLGTGGALALLPEAPTAPLVVMNGDLLTNINTSRMLAFHRAGSFAATVALREHVVKVPFGVAEVEGARVARLVEKPTLNYRINAGIYVLQPELLAEIPRGRMFPITELLDGCLKRKRTVGAYHMQETWNDIGLPEEYSALHRG